MTFGVLFIGILYIMGMNFQTNLLICVDFITFVHEFLDIPTYACGYIFVCIFLKCNIDILHVDHR